MKGSESTSLPPVDAWQPMNLQAIAFPNVPASSYQQEWWQDLAGSQPEESVRKRQERTDQGSYQGHSLTLSADLLRFVWNLAPLTPPEKLLEDPTPTLGPFTKALESFLGLMSRWVGLPNLPGIKRLALAARLIQKVADRESGYRLLGLYLPDVRLDPESTDFVYRINRKRPSRSEIPGMFINRLMTWQVLKVQTQMRGNLVGTVEMIESPVTEIALCCLDIDMNTIHEFSGEIPPSSLSVLFGELSDLAVEIATKGDTR